MLSTVSKIFDPYGFISPVVIAAKILLQSTCKSGLGWDVPVSADLLKQWLKIVDNLHHLKNVAVPRWAFNQVVDSTAKLELHIFADASESAYGVAAYLRVSSNEQVHTSLLASKTRVAPIKRLTIPRMELMGAVLAVRLSEYLLKEVHLSIKQTFFWLDSQVSLHWIRGDSNRWKPFVKHRVEEIHKKSKKELWRFCPGNQNPADLASREVEAGSLVSCELWWSGPEWLKNEEIHWPLAGVASGLNSPTHAVNAEIENEQRRVAFTVTSVVIQTREDIVDLKRVSSLHCVLRITAWIQRFARNLIRMLPNRQQGLVGETENYLTAEKDWTAVNIEKRLVPTLSSTEL